MSQILLILMFFNSLIFTKMFHPMNMGILLLIQTLMMCLMAGTMSYTAWFSYILFLVFLGGMLVLFIYMTSIASNEIFQKSNFFFIFFGGGILSLLIMIMLSIDFTIPSFNYTLESMNISNIYTENENSTLLNLYNMPTTMITIFMVIYLFLTLIVVVYITKSHQGPLRPTNN